jgi:hypothetical protein
MRDTGNQDQIAEATEQELPPEAKQAAAVLEPAVGQMPHQKNANAVAWSMELGSPAVTGLAGKLESAERHNSSGRVHEQILHLIRIETQSVTVNQPERVGVILRPDGQTEIMLNVRLQDGAVEAHARCNRGDFEMLNSQWSQLQQTLSACGVKLAPLNPPTTTPVWSHTSGNLADAGSTFSGKQQSYPVPVPTDEAAPTKGGSRTTPRIAARQRSQRLFEQWA